MSLDRMDGKSQVGVEASYLALAEGIPLHGTWMRFDAHGSYTTPSGWGAYAQLPFLYLDDPGSGGVHTAVGNLEIGVINARTLQKLGLVLHAGATLPTGSGGDDGIANYIAAVARINDNYDSIPKGTSLRFGAASLFREGKYFARVDLGFDLNLAREESDFAIVGPQLRLNVGGGIDLGPVAVTAELVNVYLIKDRVDTGDRFSNVATLAVRGSAGRLRPYGAVAIPLEDNTSRVIDAALTIGLDVALR